MPAPLVVSPSRHHGAFARSSSPDNLSGGLTVSATSSISPSQRASLTAVFRNSGRTGSLWVHPQTFGVPGPGSYELINRVRGVNTRSMTSQRGMRRKPGTPSFPHLASSSTTSALSMSMSSSTLPPDWTSCFATPLEPKDPPWGRAPPEWGVHAAELLRKFKQEQKARAHEKARLRGQERKVNVLKRLEGWRASADLKAATRTADVAERLLSSRERIAGQVAQMRAGLPRSQSELFQPVAKRAFEAGMDSVVYADGALARATLASSRSDRLGFGA